jgi:hypothetical protein
VTTTPRPHGPRPGRRSFLTALALGGASLPFACAGTTGSDRFAFYARVGGVARDPAAPFAFENDVGWRVELTRAELTLGPVYLNTVAALRSAARVGLPFVRSAHAHDSHLGDGNIVGELLAQATADLLSPEPVTFPAWGTVARDQVRTLEICYYPAPNEPPDAPGQGAVALRVAGRAERAGQALAFRGDLALDRSWQPNGQPGSNNYEPLRTVREVRGVPAVFTPAEGGFLELRVDAAKLLRGADFRFLADNPLDADGATRLLVQGDGASRPTDPVMRALFNNLRGANSGTYAAEWRDG